MVEVGVLFWGKERGEMKIETIRIKVGHRNQRGWKWKEVVAEEVLPGAFLHKSMEGDKPKYSLTHRSSGWCIMDGFKTKKQAKEIAQTCLAGIDWVNTPRQALQSIGREALSKAINIRDSK